MLWPFTGGPFQMGLSTVSLLEPQVPWGRLPSGSGLASWWPSQDGSSVASVSSSPQPAAFSSLSRSPAPGLYLPPAGNCFRGKGAVPPHLTLEEDWGSQSTAGAPS